MRIYRTAGGVLVERDGAYHVVDAAWDELLNAEDLEARLAAAARGPAVGAPASLLSPVGAQEVWAAGVTYWRSRDARMGESRAAGGGSFYDRVYDAERPELFLKA